MGGRGASSGISKKGNPYGSQYHSILEVDNIKFVEKNTRQSETLMETMTPGRVYAYVGGDDIKSIVMFDENNKRVEVIHLDHSHNGEKPHVHHGYEHDEYGPPGPPDADQVKLIEKITNIWDNYKAGDGAGR